MTAVDSAGKFRSDRRIAWAVAGLVAVSVLVLLVRLLHDNWSSSSDWAAIELRTLWVPKTRPGPLTCAFARAAGAMPCISRTTAIPRIALFLMRPAHR